MRKKRHQSLIPLSHQHHHGLVMSHRLKQLPDHPDAQAVAALTGEVVTFFRDHLTPHFDAEEKALFPVIEEHGDRPPLIDELREEHGRLSALVEQLGAPTLEIAERASLLRRFGHVLEAHIRKEERVLFPLYEERVPEPVAHRVGAHIERILKRR